MLELRGVGALGVVQLLVGSSSKDVSLREFTNGRDRIRPQALVPSH